MSGEAKLPLERVPGEAYIGVVLRSPSRRSHDWGIGVPNRAVLLGVGTFIQLQLGAEDILGEEAFAVFYEAGIKAGKEGADALLEEWDERGPELVKKALSFTDSTGFGMFKPIDFRLNPDGTAHLQIRQSFIAETYKDWKGETKGPVCHFIAGFLAGLIGDIIGIRLSCEETACHAMGNDECEFKFEPV